MKRPNQGWGNPQAGRGNPRFPTCLFRLCVLVLLGFITLFAQTDRDLQVDDLTVWGDVILQNNTSQIISRATDGSQIPLLYLDNFNTVNVGAIVNPPLASDGRILFWVGGVATALLTDSILQPQIDRGLALGDSTHRFAPSHFSGPNEFWSSSGSTPGSVKLWSESDQGFFGLSAGLNSTAQYGVRFPVAIPAGTGEVLEVSNIAAGVITTIWAPNSGGGLPVVDTTSIVEGSVDDTKEVRLEVDGLTTGTVRVLTPQDADYVLAGTNIAQTFSQAQTFSANILSASDGGPIIGDNATRFQIGFADTWDAETLAIRNAAHDQTFTIDQPSNNVLEFTDTASNVVFQINRPQTEFEFDGHIVPEADATWQVGLNTQQFILGYIRTITVATSYTGGGTVAQDWIPSGTRLLGDNSNRWSTGYLGTVNVLTKIHSAANGLIDIGDNTARFDDVFSDQLWAGGNTGTPVNGVLNLENTAGSIAVLTAGVKDSGPTATLTGNLDIGSGNLYLNPHTGAASCSGIDDAWIGVRTDAPRSLSVCIGGTLYTAALL